MLPGMLNSFPRTGKNWFQCLFLTTYERPTGPYKDMAGKRL